jgi:hypothetical protein
MHFALLIGLVPAQLGVALPQDSVDALRRAAQAAEARYERLARSLAPFTWTSASGGECDEVVGRFCLRFDSISEPPATPEATGVARAREDAVEAARRHFAAVPGDRHAAGPLVRLLVREGRTAEAASAAGAFAALTADTLWGHLLLGFAHHRNGDHDAAEHHFTAALPRMDPPERRRWLDVSWLVSDRELRALRRLSPVQREAYERRLWLLSDPFWVSAANERWGEHLSRHVESRLLARVPPVGGAVAWGDDQDELTVRYGTPSSAERMRGSAGSMGPDPLLEHWDTAGRAYVPPALLVDGFPGVPVPGAKPVLYAARARTAWAMTTVRHVLEPDHQVTRFLDGRAVLLRIDGVFGDSMVAAPPPVATLIAWDSALAVRAEQRAATRRDGDSVHFSTLMRAPPGLGYYSVEAFDTARGVAVRARYALAARVHGDALVVSDILVAYAVPHTAQPDRPDDPALRARPSLQVARGDTVGLYAEVYRRPGAGALRVEVALEPAGEPHVLVQAARWIGRVVGGAAEPADPRVEWVSEEAGETLPIVLNLPLPPDRRGLQEIVLRVTDTTSGESAESRRLVRIR